MSCAWLYIQYQTTVIWSLLRSTGVCWSVPGIQVASLLVQEHYCSGTPIKYDDNFLTENGPKTAEGSSTPFKRELGPHLTQCCLGHGRGYFAECGLRKVVLSCQGVICGKSSAERSANYPLSLFRILQVKNSAFLQIAAKLPFARIVQQMCNRCIEASGVQRCLPSVFFVVHLQQNRVVFFYNFDKLQSLFHIPHHFAG